MSNDTTIQCPNCGGETRVVGEVVGVARICETPGCHYPDGSGVSE